MDKSGHSSRFVQLDALRGIAALMVVYFHAVGACVERVPFSREYAVWHLLDWGKVGVAAFFGISGFVIPYTFRKHARPVRAFMISRIARLYPAYWCSILVALAAWYLAKSPMKPIGTILANLTMIQQAMGKPDLIGVYWTLFVELLFYAVCLAAFVAGWLRSSFFLFAAAMSFLGLAAGAAAIQSAAPVPLVSLSLMMLACLWRRVIVDGDRLAAWLTPVGVAVWLVMWPILAHWIFPEADWLRQASSWIAGIAIFAIATVLRIRVPAVLIWLGALSYAIYLYHQIVSAAVTRFLPSLVNAPHAAFLVTALGTVAVAAMSYKFIEEPCIGWGRSLAAREDSLQRESPR